MAAGGCGDWRSDVLDGGYAMCLARLVCFGLDLGDGWWR